MTKYPVESLSGVTTAQLGWLHGIWKGQRDQEQIEEQWSDLAGGTLMGMFRWLKGDSVWFYELIVVEPEDDGVMLRIKHFYPGLKGWEEKDLATEFALVELRDTFAVFLQVNKPNAPWMIYHLESEDRLIAYFERAGEPPKESDKFVYTRQR